MIPAEGTHGIHDLIHLPERLSVHDFVQHIEIRPGLIVVHPVGVAVTLIQYRQHGRSIVIVMFLGYSKMHQHLSAWFDLHM